MARLNLRWNRFFGGLFALAAVCLVVGVLANPPLHDVLLMIGVCLIASFVPLIMGIYFMRGYLGSR